MLRIKRKGLLSLFCLLYVSIAFSRVLPLGNLSKGHGAFVDDTTYSAGPTSSTTNTPGRWVPNISNFNQGATSRTEITRLYPYSGTIELKCTGPTDASSGGIIDCVYSGPGQNVFVHYQTPAFGEASVAAYRTAFPTMEIHAVFTGRADGALTYSEVGEGTADVLAGEICSDPNVDGVVLDLQPNDMVSVSPGLLAFYRRLTTNFLSASCRDANHPMGRVFGVVLNPNDVQNWSLMASTLWARGYVIVQGYNVLRAKLVTNVTIYASFLSDRVQLMDAHSRDKGIRYTVAIPAAASASEFELSGSYQASTPPCNFVALTEGYPQLDYVRAARTNILAQVTSRFYAGMDYNGWSQFRIRPIAGENLTYPCTPDVAEGVVSYLQQYG